MPTYVELIERKADLQLGLQALCDCNNINIRWLRTKELAYIDSLPWPHLRAAIRELDEQLAAKP